MPEDQRVPQNSDGEAAALKNVSLPSSHQVRWNLWV